MVHFIMQTLAGQQPTFDAGDRYRNPYIFYADMVIELALIAIGIGAVMFAIAWISRRVTK